MEKIGKVVEQAWNSAHKICEKMSDGSLCKTICSIGVFWALQIPLVLAIIMMT